MERKQAMEQKPMHESKCKCDWCESEARMVRRDSIFTRVNDAQIMDELMAYEVLRSQRGEQVKIGPKPAQPPAHRYAQFYALLEEVKALHDSKGSDYEGEGKSYCNLRGPEEWGVPAWVYAMTRCEEKMRRIKTFAKGSTLKHEGARDSLMDIAVLSLIAIVLMEEKE